MIAFEVKVNGKRVCVAGAEDLAVLTTSITAAGTLGKQTVPPRPGDEGSEIFYHVGGLTGRSDPAEDVHVNWRSIAPLRVGDVVQVTVLDVDRADRGRSRRRAARAKE